MVWKIFFIITTIIMILMGVSSNNMDYHSISSIESIADIAICIFLTFILGIFYSLGWKQQLFSKKVANILLAAFILSMIILLAIVTSEIYSEIHTQVLNKTAAVIGSMFASGIAIGILNIFLIPFYIGLYKYNISFDSLNLVKKPYWKLSSLYLITTSVSFIISGITKYTHLSSYSVIDNFAIFSCFYEILFLIGYAWDVKIFHKLFWQITAIPYIALLVSVPFCISDTFNQDFHYKEAMFGNPILLVFSAIIYVAYIYVVFKYAYSKEESIDL